MYEYRAYVRKIYDGDSITVDIDLGFGIVINNQKIRLSEINTPEIKGKDRERGLLSRDALRNKIGSKWIRIKTMKDKKGKYGRWLGTLFLDDENINEWLIKEGFAEEYK